MRSITPECIGCGMCENESKYFFVLKEGISCIANQPQTEEENEEFDRIKDMCPLHAIV